MSRSSKSLRNVITGLVNKFILLALAFATRSIFIKLLGAEYAGINSLFTNILSVLSLAELGLGNVLMFYLYKSIATHDERTICDIVYRFKKIYRIVVSIILTLGLLVVPLLKYIVKSELPLCEITIYYLLYLLNSLMSYYSIYRISVIVADQNSYINNTVNTISTVLMYVLQITYLYITRNFLGYLIIQVLHTLVTNIVLDAISRKKYPFLCQVKLSDNHGPLLKQRTIFKNIKATFLFKVSDVILDQTDSIIISMMLGTIFVGLYSNYYMVITYVVNIAAIIANGLLASFGNLNAEGDMEKSYVFFKAALFVFSIFGSFCSACYASIIQDFITIWIGTEYLLDFSTVIAVLAVFHVRMATNTMWMYRSSMGLFQEVQYINIAAAVLNIPLSILLGRIFGIAGVVAATAIARITTTFWYEGKVVYHRFNKPVRMYYLQQLKDFFVALMIVGISYCVNSQIKFSGVFTLIVKILICLLTSIIFDFLFYYRTNEFQLVYSRIMGVIRVKRKLRRLNK